MKKRFSPFHMTCKLALDLYWESKRKFQNSITFIREFRKTLISIFIQHSQIIVNSSLSKPYFIFNINRINKLTVKVKGGYQFLPSLLSIGLMSRTTHSKLSTLYIPRNMVFFHKMVHIHCLAMFQFEKAEYDIKFSLVLKSC